MLAREVDREFVQALNKLKILGSNAAPVGLKPKLAGKESLMPIKNGCEASATGPPVAPPSFRKPALIVERLCGPQCGLEVHDVLYLRRMWEPHPAHARSWHLSPGEPSLPAVGQCWDR